MTPVVFDFSDRTKLRVTGADRVRFLNGQVTNDVRRATAERALHACVITAKGKLNGDVFISAWADALLIDADADLRESLPARLERYVIADDVQIVDVTGDFALLHLLREEAPESFAGARIVEAWRFGSRGWDVWIAAAARDELLEKWRQQFAFHDAASAERFRIERGIPRWGRELTDEIIPVEANLEADCIDYAKGCYIGQEVISRMKMSGQTNKRLCGLRALGDDDFQPGMRLLADAGGTDAGWITSVARREPSAEPLALGYVKRGFNALGTLLRTASGLAVEVTALPFT